MKPANEDANARLFLNDGEGNDADIAKALAVIPNKEIVTVISLDAGVVQSARLMTAANQEGKVAATFKPEEFARVLAAGGKAKSTHVILIEAHKLKKIFRKAA